MGRSFPLFRSTPTRWNDLACAAFDRPWSKRLSRVSREKNPVDREIFKPRARPVTYLHFGRYSHEPTRAWLIQGRSAANARLGAMVARLKLWSETGIASQFMSDKTEELESMDLGLSTRLCRQRVIKRTDDAQDQFSFV